MKLTIVIPTKDRPDLLVQTLATITPQLADGVELLIVDASSNYPDPKVTSLVAPRVRYEQGKAGDFDSAYDEAVNASRGEWVWLFSDDDWFKLGAVDKVLRNLDDSIDMMIVNAEVRERRMERVLLPKWLKFESRDYALADYHRMFAELGDLGTFVGSIILRRKVWVERAKSAPQYFGSRFITFALPFLAPTPTRFLSDILVSVRFGHQGWIKNSANLIGQTMIDVVWSLPLPDWAKTAVRVKKPRFSELLLWRAIGSDVSKHSRLVSLIPRSAARAAIFTGLKVTGRSGGISDYMLSIT